MIHSLYMKSNKEGASRIVFLVGVAVLVIVGVVYYVSKKSNNNVPISEQGTDIVGDPVIASDESVPILVEDKNIPRTPPVVTSVPVSEKTPLAEISVGLQKAFSIWKDGAISECLDNGEIYYMGQANAYDGGGGTLNSKGEGVGTYHGYTGKYEGFSPRNCERIYVVEKNIWGYAPVNKYNLR